MAFSTTLNRPYGIAGGLKIITGQWNADNVTSGRIITNLTEVLGAVISNNAEGVSASGQFAYLNTAFPSTAASGSFKVNTYTNASGNFIAIGH